MSPMNARIGRSFRMVSKRQLCVFMGTLGLILGMIAISYANTPQTNTVNHITGFLTARDLIRDPSLAIRYNVTGLLIIKPEEGEAPVIVDVKLGQTVAIPLVLTFISYKTNVPTITVYFTPKPGQLYQGDLDISSLESYSVSEMIVGAQAVGVTLIVRAPNTLDQSTFPIAPVGVNTSPNVGIFVYLDTNITVDVTA